jgi:flagellar biosynthesis/type III secretory pathway M-ring protein FliF/YscJ
MARVLLYLAVLAVTIFALIDCIQTDDDKVRGIPKIGWIVLIVLIWIVGPVAWLIAGKQRSATAARGGFARPQQQQQQRRMLAPDDDPEFLRRLNTGNAEHEQMLKKWEEDLKRREKGMREGEGDEDASPGKS